MVLNRFVLVLVELMLGSLRGSGKAETMPVEMHGLVPGTLVFGEGFLVASSNFRRQGPLAQG